MALLLPHSASAEESRPVGIRLGVMLCECRCVTSLPQGPCFVTQLYIHCLTQAILFKMHVNKHSEDPVKEIQQMYQLQPKRSACAENSWELHVMQDEYVEPKQHRVHLFPILKENNGNEIDQKTVIRKEVNRKGRGQNKIVLKAEETEEDKSS